MSFTGGGVTIGAVMHRLTSAFVLGGAVLLTSYINAPAAPTPALAPVSSAEMAAIDAMAPLVADVVQETERLKSRLTPAPAQPVARRNPFGFGNRPRPAPSAPTAADTEAGVAEVIESAPAIAWPTLVAVLTGKGEASTLSAVLALGDAVEILTAGAIVGGFQIREVTATSVELVHVASSSTTRLALR